MISGVNNRSTRPDSPQMQFTTSIVLAILAAAASAAPSLELRQNGITCQTSAGSPKTVDVTTVINDIESRVKDDPNAVCDNTNSGSADGSGESSHSDF